MSWERGLPTRGRSIWARCPGSQEDNGPGKPAVPRSPRSQPELRAGQNRPRGQRDLVPAAAALVHGTALNATVPGLRAAWANEPVQPAPTKQRLPALLLGPVLVHELRQTVARLELNPIPCHVRLPIFQLLGTIRTAVAH